MNKGMYLRVYGEDELQQMKKEAQDLVMKLQLNVTFYNVFNKGNQKARKEPDRYLICMSEDLHEIKAVIEHMIVKGYLCRRGKNYLNPAADSIGAAIYSCQVDLFSRLKMPEVITGSPDAAF